MAPRAPILTNTQLSLHPVRRFGIRDDGLELIKAIDG